MVYIIDNLNHSRSSGRRLEYNQSKKKDEKTYHRPSDKWPQYEQRKPLKWSQLRKNKNVGNLHTTSSRGLTELTYLAIEIRNKQRKQKRTNNIGGPFLQEA